MQCLFNCKGLINQSDFPVSRVHVWYGSFPDSIEVKECGGYTMFSWLFSIFSSANKPMTPYVHKVNRFV